MIKAILFDLWGTLANSSPEWKEAYETAGFNRSVKQIKVFEEVINTKSYADELELAELMCKSFGGRDVNKVANLLLVSTAKFYDDVEPSIKRLKELGYAIGLVSNTHNLEIKKLSFDFFDVVILSSEVGVAKPHRHIFELACEELGVQPPECIFVGDNPIMDYEGSESAGMKPILIDRKGYNKNKPHIKDLNELIEVLENERLHIL